MAGTSTKMQILITLFVIYNTIIVVLSSDTEAEVLVPRIKIEVLQSGTEADVLIPITEAEILIPSTEAETLLTKVEDETLISNVTTESNSSHPSLVGKHESLLSCPQFTLEPGEYELFSNGTIYIEPYNLILNESYYILSNATVRFCIPFIGESVEDKEYVHKSSYLTLIGLGISMVSLLIHLVVFAIVPDLKNLPGCNLAALCTSLFCSYLLIFVIATGDIVEYGDFCIATAFLLHFCLLSSIIWMSVMSYDVFMSLLRATGSLRASTTHFSLKRFGFYCLCSFGIALVFAVASLLADVLDSVPEKFKPEYQEMCWFKKRLPLSIFFAGPVIALSCLNFIFFGLSAYTLHTNKMKQNQDDRKILLKRRYSMYFRLSVIMGVTWIVGIAAAAVNADWLWYIFVLLNTLQGFFVFIAFTCSKKVKKYFRDKYFGGRRASEQTLAPTFQSYCYYANSIEKDMDKIVENGKEKTDTIIIHL